MAVEITVYSKLVLVIVVIMFEFSLLLRLRPVDAGYMYAPEGSPTLFKVSSHFLFLDFSSKSCVPSSRSSPLVVDISPEVFDASLWPVAEARFHEDLEVASLACTGTYQHRTKIRRIIINVQGILGRKNRVK